MFKIRFLLLCCLFSLPIHGASLPDGCKLISSTEPGVRLAGLARTLYFIKNQHKYDLYLVFGQKPSLTEMIEPNKWSVLTIPQGNSLSFSCVESKPGSEQKVSCGKIIQICRISPSDGVGTKLAEKWLVENSKLKDIKDNLTQSMGNQL